jgi:hypothetical protein
MWRRWGTCWGEFDLYHPMAHPNTHPISFTYPPVASMWVVTLHSLFLYSDLPLPCHNPSYWLRPFPSQTFSRINTSTFLKPSSFFAPTCLWRQDRVLRNVGIWNSYARELARRKHTTFRTWQKSEIKYNSYCITVFLQLMLTVWVSQTVITTVFLK